MSLATAWHRQRLVDLAAPNRWSLNGGPFGSKLTSKQYVESGVPVIRGTNLSGDVRFSLNDFVYVSESTANELLANNAHPGDLVFTQRGTIGQVGLIPMDAPFRRFVISQSQMKMTPDLERIDPIFLYYYFAAPETVTEMQNLAMSSGVPHINLEILRNVSVPTPPLAEQRRIANILSAYDDLIENCQRRIRILEDMARRLYREWFVHFRFPGADAVPRVDSPLGPIPQGWATQKLGDVLQLNYGKALKKDVRRDGSVPVFGSSGVVGQHDESLAPAPGIVVGRKGNVGSVFWCDEPFFVIDTAYYVTATLPLRFLFYDLQTKNFINNDSAVPGLSRHQAYALDTLVPPLDLLAKFCQLADSFEAQAAIHRRKITNLRRTRDLLLPRLLSGQIDLAEKTAA